MGTKRARKMVLRPCLSKKACVLSRCSGLIHRDLAARLPTRRPIEKLTVSPSTVAATRTANSRKGLKWPRAANAPAANSSESPGRKGTTTRPVSMKMTTNRMT